MNGLGSGALAVGPVVGEDEASLSVESLCEQEATASRAATALVAMSMARRGRRMWIVLDTSMSMPVNWEYLLVGR